MPPEEATMRAELVAHFRRSRDDLRRQWVRLMTDRGLLTGLSPEEVETGTAAFYDIFVSCLETARYDQIRARADELARRGVPRGMTTQQILGVIFTLCDVLERSLIATYRLDQEKLWAALDIYQPVANEIVSIAAMAFIQHRENLILQQQQAIRELSTPVLQLRPGLLIMPMIGLIDTARARQITEQLLHAIRDRRARVVVMDLTGVPVVDSKVANHLLQTVEAARLLGASVVVTGISPEIAQTLVGLGVELRGLNTVGDLQGGIEEADRLLGYRTVKVDGPAEAGPTRAAGG